MPYRAHGHRRGTVMRERIASLAPRTGDRCSFTHRDRGALGNLALRASRASPFPSAPGDTIGARTVREPRHGRPWPELTSELEFINDAKLVFTGTSDLCRKHLRTS
jgi:hypothetical protein